MKKLAALLILAAATAASAAPMLAPGGTYHATRPARIEQGGAIVNVGSDQWLADNAGWSYATPERIAQEDAAELAVAEESAAQAALPQVFPTGIATLDDEGHHIELVPDMVDGVVVPVQISNSPLTVKDREAMKAAAVAVRAQAKAEKAALKAEVKDAKNDKAKLVAILKWIESQ